MQISHWVRYTQLELVSGFGPTDSALATVALDVQVGELFDTVATTDVVVAVSGHIRTATDSLPTLIEFPYSPDLVTPPGPGWILFDSFDRNDVNYLLDSLGTSTSGWTYPFDGSSSTSPEYDTGEILEAVDVLLVGNPSTTATFRYVQFQTPSAGRIAIQFDWMWPVAERPNGAGVSRVGDSSFSGFGVDIDEMSPGVYHLTAYMEDANLGTGEWSVVPEPNEWFTVRAIFPWGLSIGQVFGVKAWIRGEDEPDDWLVYDVVTAGLQIWAPATGIYEKRGFLSFSVSYADSSPFIQGAPLVLDNLELYDPLARQIPGALGEVIPIGTDTISYVWTHDPIDFPRALTDDATIGLDGVGLGDSSDLVLSSIGRVQPAVEPENPLEVQAKIVIDGVNFTDDVIWADSTFSTRTGGGIGICSIRIKDLDRTRAIVTGSEIVVRYRGVRVWGGYVKQVARNYAFSYGEDDSDRPWARFLVIEGVDYNILLDTRVLHDKSNVLNVRLYPPWPVGTSDSTAVIHMIQKQLVLGDLDLGFNIKTTTDVAPYEPFAPAHAGFTWNQGMATIVDRTRAVYYIDPDKVFNYVDDSVKASSSGGPACRISPTTSPRWATATSSSCTTAPSWSMTSWCGALDRGGPRWRSSARRPRGRFPRMAAGSRASSGRTCTSRDRSGAAPRHGSMALPPTGAGTRMTTASCGPRCSSRTSAPATWWWSTTSHSTSLTPSRFVRPTSVSRPRTTSRSC